MKSIVVIGLFAFALSTAACTASTSPSESSISSADHLVLDVRCATNADCPATFECELESEHGAPRSFCKSHDTIGSAASPSCPAGTEAEVEHGTTFCKAHGGGTASGGGTSKGTGTDDDAGTSKGSGTDDDASAPSGSGSSSTPGADDDAGTSTSGGTAAGGACVTSADCASGLECDVSSSTCKAHGGKKI